jgi:uncharacterized protein (UPF0332 family)
MSFDWKDYIKLAKKLYDEVNKDSMEEAYNRAIISRSYYGIFCISRIKAGLESYRPRLHTSDPGVHEKVIGYYKNSNKPEEKQAGKILDDLRRYRNNADYDRNKNIDRDLAERAILKANEVLSIFGEGI